MRESDSDSLLRRYDRACQRAAAQVIQTYSTSFRLATGLLAPRVREDIRALYAVVRIADEIVDGTATAGGVERSRLGSLLDDYEHQVLAAPATRFHTDPVLHAYAIAARRCGFQNEHISDFFASMRRDLTQTSHDEESFAEYVYGSAEVIGLLCLAVFYADESRPVDPDDYAELEHGARRLGAAFQKINFLRDLADDSAALGRSYFPGAERGIDDAAKDQLVADIREDLAVARPMAERLPRGARAGVIAAADLFERLTDQLDEATVDELYRLRVSVNSAEKSMLLARSLVRSARKRKGTGR